MNFFFPTMSEEVFVFYVNFPCDSLAKFFSGKNIGLDEFGKR